MKKNIIIAAISFFVIILAVSFFIKSSNPVEEIDSSTPTQTSTNNIKVGDWLYIPSESYITHGKDDIVGGLVQVSRIAGSGFLEIEGFLEFEGFEGNSYNPDILLESQEDLKKEFGDQKAYKNPDLRDEFNTNESDFTIYDDDGSGIEELKELLSEVNYQEELEKDADKIKRKFSQ